MLANDAPAYVILTTNGALQHMMEGSEMGFVCVAVNDECLSVTFITYNTT